MDITFKQDLPAVLGNKGTLGPYLVGGHSVSFSMLDKTLEVLTANTAEYCAYCGEGHGPEQVCEERKAAVARAEQRRAELLSKQVAAKPSNPPPPRAMHKGTWANKVRSLAARKRPEWLITDPNGVPTMCKRWTQKGVIGKTCDHPGCAFLPCKAVTCNECLPA